MLSPAVHRDAPVGKEALDGPAPVGHRETAPAVPGGDGEGPLQVHPEDHRDLIVRVAGYSAFFNVLSKATQDDIIGRTEQTL